MRIALSFDDGPNNITTPQVLDLLEEHRIPASFFLIANNIVPETEGQIRRALSLGCDIENHSITHRPMAEMPAEEIKEEIRVCSEKIAAITGECPRFFRPPFISVSPALFDAVDLTFICGVGCEDWVPEVPAEERIRRILEAAADGVIYLLHDMTGNINTVEDDWDTRGGYAKDPDKVFKRVTKKIEPGWIFLFHLDGKPTPAVLDRLIPYLQEQGYECVTVSELLASGGMELPPLVEEGSDEFLTEEPDQDVIPENASEG